MLDLAPGPVCLKYSVVSKAFLSIFITSNQVGCMMKISGDLDKKVPIF